MSLTKVDCDFFRGRSPATDTSSFVALNAGMSPGSLVVAGAWAVREGIGSQVASKLALEHFVQGVLGFYESGRKYVAIDGEEPPAEVSLQVLETAFRTANSAVYEFGTKLAAGGRMCASLIGLVMEESTIAAARAGPGAAYLCRAGEVFPFFEERERKNEDPALGFYVGAQSLVSVELAAVPMQESDTVLVFPAALDAAQEECLKLALARIDFSERSCASQLAAELFPDEGAGVPFIISAKIGPDVVYLSTPLVERDGTIGMAL